MEPQIPVDWRKPWRWPQWAQVVAGIVVGLIAGGLSGAWGGGAERSVFELGGLWFLNGLKMMVVPLVVTSLVAAVAGLGRMDGFGRLGAKTIVYYLSTSLVAILIGLSLVNLVRPGVDAPIDAVQAAQLTGAEGSGEAAKLAEFRTKTDGKGFLDSFKELVPANIVGAAAADQMLGLILFSLLFACFLLKLPESPRQHLTSSIDALYQLILAMTLFVLRFLPLGVACLIAGTVAKAVADQNFAKYFTALSWFAVVVVAGLILHAAVVMPLVVVRLLGKVHPWRFVQALGPALITAFSTASSSATLPQTLTCVQERAGISRRVSGFTIPLGATVNMDGTALYECVAVMFLAQLAGIELHAAEQVLVVALALLTSIGVAGIPSASLIAIAVILSAVNAQLPDGQRIPDASLALILIVDRPLDMCRTAVNIWGDACCAAAIAHSEGERGPLSVDA